MIGEEEFQVTSSKRRKKDIFHSDGSKVIELHILKV